MLNAPAKLDFRAVYLADLSYDADVDKHRALTNLTNRSAHAACLELSQCPLVIFALNRTAARRVLRYGVCRQRQMPCRHQSALCIVRNGNTFPRDKEFINSSSKFELGVH